MRVGAEGGGERGERAVGEGRMVEGRGGGVGAGEGRGNEKGGDDKERGAGQGGGGGELREQLRDTDNVRGTKRSA